MWFCFDCLKSLEQWEKFGRRKMYNQIGDRADSIIVNIFVTFGEFLRFISLEAKCENCRRVLRGRGPFKWQLMWLMCERFWSGISSVACHRANLCKYCISLRRRVYIYRSDKLYAIASTIWVTSALLTLIEIEKLILDNRRYPQFDIKNRRS